MTEWIPLLALQHYIPASALLPPAQVVSHSSLRFGVCLIKCTQEVAAAEDCDTVAHLPQWEVPAVLRDQGSRHASGEGGLDNREVTCQLK